MSLKAVALGVIIIAGVVFIALHLSIHAH